MDLQSGQNAAVGTGPLRISVTCDPANQAASLDPSAFLLDAAGRVRGDPDFVFYGQQRHPSGAVSLDAVAGTFQIDPARMPSGIERLILALSIDSEVAGLQSFAAFRSVQLRLAGSDADLHFALDTAGMKEAALIMGELYLRNGVWKLRALGQGFAGGLAPLARNYGVDVSEKSAPAPAPPPPPAAPRTGPSRIDLNKREPVSLEKPAAGFGRIEINLNWSRGEVKRGLFGTKSAAIDLDLGCMVEHMDGYKSVVQALGNTFGSLEQPPYAQLLGDDRTGDVSSGETLIINGERWNLFKRVLVYAFIYEGVPNWAAADGVVTVTVPGSPQLVARMDEHATGKGMCAIAMLENDGGRIRVTKLVDYFQGHQLMDRAFGFGFRWTTGRK
jgi:tellurite resistance protein TerA